MTTSGLDVFDETLQKTNLLLREIEQHYGWEGRRHQSYSAVRAVLQTLRDRLTVDEAAQFAAQLPLLLKGVFYDHWDPSGVPKKYDDVEFMEQVRRALPFDVEGGVPNLVVVVLQSLRAFISPGEFEDVLSIMPAKLQAELLKAA
jgi:uncharacterized protein (DUF2267 family)